MNQVIEILKVTLSQDISPENADKLVKVAIEMLEDLTKE